MDWQALIKDYGVPVVALVAFAYAFLKGYVVSGKTHDDVKAQRDRALDLVFKLANSIEAATTNVPADARRPTRRGREPHDDQG